MHLAPALEHLATRAGRYSGKGTNFEGQPFAADLELHSQVSGNLIQITFNAKDESSAFHVEQTWVSTDLETDRLCLWTVSSNTPGVLHHVLAEDSADEIRERRLVFRLGFLTETNTFRQEITLDLMKNGNIEYRYGWAVPHEKFAVRVHAVLQPSL